jgi:hypothetical protein
MRGKLDRGTRASFARTCLGKARPRLALFDPADPGTENLPWPGHVGVCIVASGTRRLWLLLRLRRRLEAKAGTGGPGLSGHAYKRPSIPRCPSPLAASPWLVFGAPELDRDRRLFQLRVVFGRRGRVRRPLWDFDQLPTAGSGMISRNS